MATRLCSHRARVWSAINNEEECLIDGGCFFYEASWVLRNTLLHHIQPVNDSVRLMLRCIESTEGHVSEARGTTEIIILTQSLLFWHVHGDAQVVNPVQPIPPHYSSTER
jgi:hypothetical protein